MLNELYHLFWAIMPYQVDFQNDLILYPSRLRKLEQVVQASCDLCFEQSSIII